MGRLAAYADPQGVGKAGFNGSNKIRMHRFALDASCGEPESSQFIEEMTIDRSPISVVVCDAIHGEPPGFLIANR
jgi:hypothetical protein